MIRGALRAAGDNDLGLEDTGVERVHSTWWSREAVRRAVGLLVGVAVIGPAQELGEPSQWASSDHRFGYPYALMNTVLASNTQCGK